jgi:hypothetical protein
MELRVARPRLVAASAQTLFEALDRSGEQMDGAVAFGNWQLRC